MASRYKDRQPAPGCTSETERLEKAQSRDRRHAAPSVRMKARGTRTEPRRAWKGEARVSQPFRKPKAAPRLAPEAQTEMDAKIEAAIAKIEGNLRAKSAARVAAVTYKPFRSTARERIAAACHLA